ncbi:hypothetical protein LCGC14_1463600 [marine sediment metagenome]|uniref:Uncharacterized protein n=1 Tax=marine sediment metagenome TaxID=412755 RepID=A0A0F9K0D0_9ZZZZ
MVIKTHLIHQKENLNYKTFKQVLTILEGFKQNLNKRFNFSKLGQYLRLGPSEVDQIISIILTFQDLFENVFKTYTIKKKMVNNQIYLITEPQRALQCLIPHKIRITKHHLDLLNDIIYFFKFVKRGKGFDVVGNGSDLLKNVRELFEYYPYFFQEKNDLIYPSELGLELGELILSFKKNSKHVKRLQVKEHTIIVE